MPHPATRGKPTNKRHQLQSTTVTQAGRIPLAHATVYLATAPKSYSAYAAQFWRRCHQNGC